MCSSSQRTPSPPMSATLKTTGTRVLEGAAAAKKQVRDVFAKYDSGEGTISQEALADVLAELDGKRPTTHQILFALKSMEVPPEGVITLKELSEYWQRVQAGHAGGRLNKLLVKDKVGTVRTSTYDLPRTTHAFGKPNAEQEFGAKEVLTSWSGREGEAPRIGASWSPTRTLDAYGRPNRPSTPVSSVIKAEYAGEGAASSKEEAYPKLPSRKKPALVPKTTAAHELRTTTVAAAATVTETKPWKMSKFEKVKSRLVA